MGNKGHLNNVYTSVAVTIGYQRNALDISEEKILIFQVFTAMAADARSIRSNKNKPTLIHESFIYHQYKVKDDIISWRCVKRCGGWVKQVGNEYLLTKEHNHLATPTEAACREFHVSYKKRAIEFCNELPMQNIAAAKRTYSSVNIAPHLALEGSQKANISRWRKAVTSNRITGNTRCNLQIPPESVVTLRNQNFLIYDSNDRDRILIFSTASNLEILGRCNVWLLDGTFKVCPTMYYQVYTIHGATDDWALPLVYALLPDKNRETYTKLLNAVVSSSQGNIVTPEVIVCDFELAAIQAMSTVFETAAAQGCMFHFNQCLHRNLPISMKKAIQDGDLDLELLVKKFAALAFVPASHIPMIFDSLIRDVNQNQVQKYPELKEFCDYFRDNFIGSRISGARFSPDIWSVYNRVRSNIPRTNNSLEGWNHRLNNKVNASHPTVANLIEVFKDEQHRVEDMLKLQQTGNQILHKRSKYVELDQRLVKLVNDFNNREYMYYLEGVAHNMMSIKKLKKKSRTA